MRGVNNSQEVLCIIPGIVIDQHQEGGKAEQIFLRGFIAIMDPVFNYKKDIYSANKGVFGTTGFVATKAFNLNFDYIYKPCWLRALP